jgi:predicted metal-binding protein
MTAPTRPILTPAYSVTQSAPHQILVCQTCRHAGETDRPGERMLPALREAIETAGIAGIVEVTGSACMAGCARPCTVAVRADGKATWFFGELEDSDIADLVAFAKLYLALDDGWCRSGDRPGKLADHTLARIPAARPVGPEVSP